MRTWLISINDNSANQQATSLHTALARAGRQIESMYKNAGERVKRRTYIKIEIGGYN